METKRKFIIENDQGITQTVCEYCLSVTDGDFVIEQTPEGICERCEEDD